MGEKDKWESLNRAMVQRAREDHIPLMEEEGLNFLLQEAGEVRPSSILEVGTAIGYSAIQLAIALPQAEIDTLEIDPERASQAWRNIQQGGFLGRIHIHLIDALLFQPEPADKVYDFLFIDGPKAQYRAHLEHFLPNLRPGGRILFDDMEFHGMVDQPGLTHNYHTLDLVRKLRQFREEMWEDPRFEVHYYKEVGNGIMTAVYRGQGR